MKELGEILGAGWPIESAAQRMGIPVTEAYSMIRADPQLQMRIFQLRGHPINLDEVSPADQLAQIKREAMPSIFTLAYVRDNLEARLQDRLKAAEVLLKMNPDLEVTRKVEAEVIHHHVLEVPQLAGLKSIMEEIAHPSQPAIEAECVALGEKQEEE
jgi:hypothetical protein